MSELALAAAHYRSVGVARPRLWNTWRKMRAMVRFLDVNPKRPIYRNRRRRGVQYDNQWWDENREPVTDRFSQWLLG